MTSNEALALLPDTKGCVVILSGGMDSTITMRLAVEKYGKENVSALTFDYGQKQKREIDMARITTNMLGVKHKIVDAGFLGAISKGFSANVDTDMEMPTIKDVLGDATPKTYVPNRNMILLSIAAAFAETQGVEYVFTGLQIHDEYSYWDTTARFVEKMNSVMGENRKIKIKLVAPFCTLSKKQELKILEEIDGNLDLLFFTLTCYNPDVDGRSCGVCPSCSERVKNFADYGIKDSIPYSIDIPWQDLIEKRRT
jgi:7-cyano-7-deazaguanine synthase